MSCTPYKFTLTNNSKASLEYYLNLEYQTDAPEDTINIAFATCGDTSCTNPAYNVSKLSEILDNEDTMLSKYSGKLLTSGSDIEQGTSNTYSIIMWIDKDSEHEDATLTTSVTAITYTQSQNLLSYKVTFDLKDKGTWTTETCKTSEGYTINGTKCEKNVDVNETYGTIPEVTIDGKVVLWYSNGIIKNEATEITTYTLKSNPIYTPTIIDLTQSFNYDYTGGEQIFTVPKTGTYKIETWGAQGGTGSDSGNGGYGGYASGVIQLSKNETLYIYVGEAGIEGTNGINSTSTVGQGGRSTFNGGGSGGLAGGGTYPYENYYGGNSGGGATDIRLISGEWNASASLNSRIMVAGGGGGYSNISGTNVTTSNDFGNAGGLISQKGSTVTNYGSTSYTDNAGTLASQISGYSFGIGGKGDNTGANGFCGGHHGGGGGYYGGGGGANTGTSCFRIGGGGGSSYISGHTGSVAITSSTSTTPKSNCKTGTTNNTCSIHYSGKVFTNTVMIDGSGYKWTNTKGTLEQMPNPSGGYYASNTGNTGNGYAKITYVG